MRARNLLGGVAAGAGLIYLIGAKSGDGALPRWGEGASPGRGGRFGSRLGDIDGLEAANLGSDSPKLDAARIARLAGALLAAYGALRRGGGSRRLRILGIGLAAVRGRARLAPSPRGRERRRTTDIQQTLFVQAPLSRVYTFVSSYESLPLFLSDVLEVRDLGGGRSRWVVGAREGGRAAWNVRIVERVQDRVLVWRSERGTELEHAGVLRFRAEGAGTRIAFRFCYSPPRGRAATASAGVFDGDPRQRMTDDIGRLKGLLESTTGSDRHGQE